MKIKITLVDDEALITDLLAQFLEQNTEIEVITTFNSGTSFINNLTQSNLLPDVFIVDFRLGDMDGLELIKKLRASKIDTPVILLSSHYNVDVISFMVKTGFAAFLPKSTKPSTLIEVIHEVHTKGFYLLPEQFSLLREQMTAKTPPMAANLKVALSEREIEILYLIAQQKTGKEIAELLFISPKTVEGHKNSLFLKTGAKNVVGLIVYGVQHKLLDIHKIVLN